MIFLQSLAQLAVRGIDVDTAVLFGRRSPLSSVCRTMPGKQPLLVRGPRPRRGKARAFAHPFLKRQTRSSPKKDWRSGRRSIGVQKFPYLRDHRVDGRSSSRRPGHIELAWAAACEQFRHKPFFLENLQFDSALILPDNSRQTPADAPGNRLQRRGLSHLQPARATRGGRGSRRRAAVDQALLGPHQHGRTIASRKPSCRWPK